MLQHFQTTTKLEQKTQIMKYIIIAVVATFYCYFIPVETINEIKLQDVLDTYHTFVTTEGRFNLSKSIEFLNNCTPAVKALILSSIEHTPALDILDKYKNDLFNLTITLDIMDSPNLFDLVEKYRQRHFDNNRDWYIQKILEIYQNEHPDKIESVPPSSIPKKTSISSIFLIPLVVGGFVLISSLYKI